MTLGFDEQYEVYREFIEVKHAEDLESFIKDRSTKHDKYSHYTMVRALNSIRVSQTFIVTKASMLNDKVEGEGASHDILDRTYIASFSHELQENLGEWVLYGDRGYGIRFSFDKYLMDKLCRVDRGLAISEENNMEIPISIVANDVVYYDVNDKKSKVALYYDDCKNTEIYYDDFRMLQERIPFAFKPAIWRYEHETRLIITTERHVDAPKLSIDFPCGEDLNVISGPLLSEAIKGAALSKYEGTISILF